MMKNSILFIFAIAAFLAASSLSFADGDVMSLRDYKYWDNGRASGCDIYNPEGHLLARSYNRPDGTVKKIEKYDINKNRTETIFYDEKGNLATGIDGWAARRWWYDGSTIVFEVTYNEDGKPISRKAYSRSGRLVAAQFSQDADINPYEEANARLILMGKTGSFRK